VQYSSIPSFVKLFFETVVSDVTGIADARFVCLEMTESDREGVSGGVATPASFVDAMKGSYVGEAGGDVCIPTGSGRDAVTRRFVMVSICGPLSVSES
jgi:hypothetical protein